MYRNVFGLIVDIDDYEAGTYLQTKHATYREIQMWVKERYGLHVSNHAISQVKALCGLARDGPGGAEGQRRPEAAVRQGSRHPRGVSLVWHHKKRMTFYGGRFQPGAALVKFLPPPH